MVSKSTIMVALVVKGLLDTLVSSSGIQGSNELCHQMVEPATLKQLPKRALN